MKESVDKIEFGNEALFVEIIRVTDSKVE